jgi:hypothetical protein
MDMGIYDRKKKGEHNLQANSRQPGGPSKWYKWKGKRILLDGGKIKEAQYEFYRGDALGKKLISDIEAWLKENRDYINKVNEGKPKTVYPIRLTDADTVDADPNSLAFKVLHGRIRKPRDSRMYDVAPNLKKNPDPSYGDEICDLLINFDQSSIKTKNSFYKPVMLTELVNSTTNRLDEITASNLTSQSRNIEKKRRYRSPEARRRRNMRRCERKKAAHKCL